MSEVQSFNYERDLGIKKPANMSEVQPIDYKRNAGWLITMYIEPLTHNTYILYTLTHNMYIL